MIARALKHQLRLWLLLTMLVVLSISAVLSYRHAQHYATQAFDQALLRTVLALSDEVVVDDQQHVRIELPDVAQRLLSYNDGDHLYLRINAPNGHLVAGDTTLPLPKRLPLGNQHVFFNAQRAGESIRGVVFALPTSLAQHAPIILLAMAETTVKRDAMVADMVEEILVPQILVMVLATIVIELGLFFALKPMQDLKQALHERSSRDLSALDTQSTPLELKPLIEAMNGLLARVKASVQQQQQFIADASHQLRTPIAGLQTQAELALRANDPQTQHETLRYLLQSATRLSHLIQRLLSMAKTDTATSQFQTVRLISVIHEVCARWIGAASDKHITLDVAIETDADQVWGEAILLAEMLGNLVDNAIQYTPTGGTITLRLWQAAETLCLQVTDSGIGIPVTEQDRIFERFHRIDPNVGNGCGLGLAIVAEILAQHGAQIDLSTGDKHPTHNTQGSQFTVKFTSYVPQPTHPSPAPTHLP